MLLWLHWFLPLSFLIQVPRPAMAIPSWACPACTVFQEKRYVLNSAPYRLDKKDNQGTDHVKGKKHRRAMKHIGSHLLCKKTVDEFFDYLDDYPKPDLSRIDPALALMEYIANCEGDADKTMVHLTPPPPSPLDMPMQRPMIKAVVRNIISKPYATSYGTHETRWTRLLCCWDDSVDGSRCIREDCPYLHWRDLLNQHPEATAHGLYELVPCTFAGTGKGCRWHGSQFHGCGEWDTPLFELETMGENPTTPVAQPPASEGAVEYVPKHTGSQWTLLPRRKTGGESPIREVQVGGYMDVAKYERELMESIGNWLAGSRGEEEERW